MRKYEKKSAGLISLKAKIRGFEIVSKAISKEAYKKSGDRRSNIKLKKRELGQACRHYLTAYALIRNVPFSKLERKCHEGNYLNPDKVLRIIEEHASHAYWHDVEKNRQVYRKWTIQDVKDKLIREQDDIK